VNNTAALQTLWGSYADVLKTDMLPPYYMPHQYAVDKKVPIRNIGRKKTGMQARRAIAAAGLHADQWINISFACIKKQGHFSVISGICSREGG
jgi:hypothetical protein